MIKVYYIDTGEDIGHVHSDERLNFFYSNKKVIEEIRDSFCQEKNIDLYSIKEVEAEENHSDRIIYNNRCFGLVRITCDEFFEYKIKDE